MTGEKFGFSFRPARPGDGATVFDLTQRSAAGLSKDHYSAEQIDGWMGDRTPAFYETEIEKGRMIVAEQDVLAVGFVGAEPGEVTRLFILPDWAGKGLGRELLKYGIALAADDHDGPIRVESTLNAEGFYRKHGFHRTGLAHFSHGGGGIPLEVVLMERPAESGEV